jgi:hypothetical protein
MLAHASLDGLKPSPYQLAYGRCEALGGIQGLERLDIAELLATQSYASRL